LVALVGGQVPDELAFDLEDAGIRVARVPDVKAAVPTPLIDRPDFNSTFNKIHAWGLHEDYDRLVYLDAGELKWRRLFRFCMLTCALAVSDVLVLHNLDELFALDLADDMPIAAAPEIMPPDKFNTGVMVVKPSAKIYSKLLEAAAANEKPDDYDQVVLAQLARISTLNPSRPA
jgi:alpha-N-acetylglucosamine transferase